MFLDKFLELGNFEQTSIRISDFSHDDILQTTNVQNWNPYQLIVVLLHLVLRLRVFCFLRKTA